MGTDLTKANTTSMAKPSYLSGNESSGLGELDSNDFKIPRVMLLQALSPAVNEHKGEAIPGHFWHNGLNIDLGPKVNIVPLLVRKRVILWRPQTDQGGGMLAFSADCKTWQSGGNTRHTVFLKGIKEPVIWDTKDNVMRSGLLNWGTSNPADPNSPPAATMSYEYLCYFPDMADIGPAVLSCNKTGLARARQFNTALGIKANANIPAYALMVEMTAAEEKDGNQVWTVPSFKLSGYIPEETFKITKALHEQHKNYVAAEEKPDNIDVSDEKAF